MALTTDFPRVWNDPHTTDRDRKRLVRLMLEDVTLIKTHEVTLHVRFRGGATQTLSIPAARPPWQTYVTPPKVVQMIDSLLNQSTDEQVAAILNQRGLHTSKGGAFRSRIHRQSAPWTSFEKPFRPFARGGNAHGWRDGGKAHH